ncbi:Unannotated [Lentimonas sp. CC19]|nr:Unannotated [Lentimonas sp. CC10]CAA6697331.1 Unannotated [Lentimonas sp. CC19]CAA7072256.1 Unannotated [Lentimonas sp. CC11]
MFLSDGGIATNQVPSFETSSRGVRFYIQCKDPVYGSAGLVLHPTVTSYALQRLQLKMGASVIL